MKDQKSDNEAEREILAELQRKYGMCVVKRNGEVCVYNQSILCQHAENMSDLADIDARKLIRRISCGMA